MPEAFNLGATDAPSISESGQLIQQNSIEAVYFVDLRELSHVSALAHDLRRSFPTIGLTFIDQNQMPSI